MSHFRQRSNDAPSGQDYALPRTALRYARGTRSRGALPLKKNGPAILLFQHPGIPQQLIQPTFCEPAFAHNGPLALLSNAVHL
jgi:hypothetical protein